MFISLGLFNPLCYNFPVGLNNIKETDFVNVTIQSLMRVTPLRNFFLIPENYYQCKFPLVHRFGELTRKIQHAWNFKGQVCLWYSYCQCRIFIIWSLSFRMHVNRLAQMSFYRQWWKPVRNGFGYGCNLTQLSSCHGFLICYMQILKLRRIPA